MISKETDKDLPHDHITEKSDDFQLVGLKNQGATCYLNCVLQTLYHLPYFRLAVFKHRIEDITNEKLKNIFFQFQVLFTLLQKRQNSHILTKPLTKSFGWKDSYTRKQQDAQSFFLWLLSDILLPVLPKVISELFEGKIRTIIYDEKFKTIKEVDEAFYDLSMNVKNCQSLEESFSKYIEAEALVGDNQYFSSPSRGSLNATIQNTFVKMPKVLFLHLKRTEFNLKNRKLNSYFSFPSILDISPYLNRHNEHHGSTQYELYGVMVHHGSCATGGHYYSYIKTSKNGDWYKFNDSFVIKATEKSAIENNFGGESKDPYNNGCNMSKAYSAYMLTYIQKSQIDYIFRDVNAASIPKHLLDYKPKNSKKQIFFIYADESFNMAAAKGHLNISENESIEQISISSNKEISHIYEKISRILGINIQSFDLWMMDDNMKLVSILDRNSSEMIESINIKNLLLFKNDQNEKKLSPNQKIIFIYFYYRTAIFPLRYLFSIAINQNQSQSIIFEKLFTVIDAKDENISIEDLDCYEFSSIKKAEPIQISKIDKKLKFPKIVNGSSYIFQYKGNKDLSNAPIFKPIQLNKSNDVYLIENVRHKVFSTFSNFFNAISLVSIFGFADNFSFSANWNLICPSNFDIQYLLELISKISNENKYQLFAKRILEPIHVNAFDTIDQLHNFITQNNGFHAPLLYISHVLEAGVVPINVVVSYDAIHPDYFERIFIVPSQKVCFIDVMKMLRKKIDPIYNEKEIRVVIIKNKKICFICNVERSCMFDADWIRFEIIPINQRIKFLPNIQKLCQCRYVSEFDKIKELPFFLVIDNTDTFDSFIDKLKQLVLIDTNSEVYLIKNKKQVQLKSNEAIFDYIDINTIILLRV